MNTEAWPAPAKINLFLHITGRNADGYHSLQTVFQFLDYCDALTFTAREDGQICRTGNYQDIPEQDDLIIRAAHSLRKFTDKETPGVDIQINKCLPMGGGLGGGSSDAATTLVALNHLWGLELTSADLATIGLKLGADLPVFVHGHAAWAEGVGEQLSPIEVPEGWFLVIHPGCHISTAEVFNASDLTRNTPAITIRDFLHGAGGNDCETVVRKRYPEVNVALNWLAERAEAKMTGTGACIFAMFSDEAAARAVLAELPSKWRGFVAQGRNRSPLLERLGQETA